MSISGQGEIGEIVLFEDFCGPEVQAANAEAATTPGHAIGPFKVVGKTAETDSGIELLGKSSGYARLTGNDEDGKGVGVATEVCFSPVLNGTLVVECRLELAALTARNVFVGLAGTVADDVAEPVTATGSTITKVVPCVGFLFDSQLSNGTYWHMPYILASGTTQVSTTVQSSQVAVTGESDILRLEVDPNGAARWYINGVLEQSVGAGLAATPSTLLGALAAVFGTTTTACSADVDYFLVKANRDWTR